MWKCLEGWTKSSPQEVIETYLASCRRSSTASSSIGDDDDEDDEDNNADGLDETSKKEFADFKKWLDEAQSDIPTTSPAASAKPEDPSPTIPRISTCAKVSCSMFNPLSNLLSNGLANVSLTNPNLKPEASAQPRRRAFQSSQSSA